MNKDHFKHELESKNKNRGAAKGNDNWSTSAF